MKQAIINKLREFFTLQPVEKAWVFGSYSRGEESRESDIDIAIYTEDFEFYKKMAVYLEQYFARQGICSDIFYIDITMEEPIYGVPFNIKV